MVIKKVIIDKANRLYQLPPGIMRFLAPQSRRGLLKRTELLDLASFNWPVPFESLPGSDVSPMQPAPPEKINHLKEELAGWYQAVHGARLLPTKEIYVGGGISNILFSLALAFVDHGDIAFVPDLGVPLYRTVVTACGAEAVSYTVSVKDGWRPNFERVGNIPLTDYAPPGTDAVPKALEPHLEENNAFLLRNHGLLTIGRDLDEAYNRHEVVEHLARIVMLARQLGNVETIPSDDFKRLETMRRKLDDVWNGKS